MKRNRLRADPRSGVDALNRESPGGKTRNGRLGAIFVQHFNWFPGFFEIRG
jgi:hypothetical protein